MTSSCPKAWAIATRWTLWTPFGQTNTIPEAISAFATTFALAERLEAANRAVDALKSDGQAEAKAIAVTPPRTYSTGIWDCFFAYFAKIKKEEIETP